MRLWRSLLFVPANQKRMLDKTGGLHAAGLLDADGEPDYFVSVIEDIGARKAAEAGATPN